MACFDNLLYTVYKKNPNGGWNEVRQDLKASEFNIQECELKEESIALQVPTDVVCIDIDIGKNDGKGWIEVCKKLIEQLDLKNTKYYGMWSDHGMHLYFKNKKMTDVIQNSVGGYSICGLKPVDYKTGLNGNNKMTIVKDGRIRDWFKKPSNPVKFQSEELDFVPAFLLPSSDKYLVGGMSIHEIDEGSRNNTFFKFGKAILKHFDNSQKVKEVLEFANHLIEKPLDERELRVICNSLTKTKLSENKSFMFDPKTNEKYYLDFAKYLVGLFEAVLIDNVPYIYDDMEKRYRPLLTSSDYNYIEKIMFAMQPLKDVYRKEVVKAFSLLLKPSEFYDLKITSKICCKNGILDPETKTLIPHTPSIFTKIYLPFDYDPTAYDEEVDKYINEFLVERGDKEQRLIFEELCLGSVLFDYNDICKKGCIIEGPPSTTKSKCVDMIKNFLGSDNYSSVSFKQICENGKSLMQLASGIANFDADLDKGGTMPRSNLTIFKKLIGSSADFNVEPLYQEAKKVRIRTKLIGATNEMWAPEGHDQAIFDRFVILRATNTRPNSWNDSPNLSDSARVNKLNEVLNSSSARKYLLRLAVEGWSRYNASGFTHSETSQKAHDRWYSVSSYVQRWCSEAEVKINFIVGKSRSALIQQCIRFFKNEKGWNISLKTDDFDKQLLSYANFIGKLKVNECGIYENV